MCVVRWQASAESRGTGGDLAWGRSLHHRVAMCSNASELRWMLFIEGIPLHFGLGQRVSERFWRPLARMTSSCSHKVARHPTSHSTCSFALSFVAAFAPPRGMATKPTTMDSRARLQSMRKYKIKPSSENFGIVTLQAPGHSK